MNSATEVRRIVVTDSGPVRTAALMIALNTTLKDHVIVSDDASMISIPDDAIPFHMWGSGTQGLWLLLCSMCHSDEQVSIYQVMSRLDRSNLQVAGTALAVLTGAFA